MSTLNAEVPEVKAYGKDIRSENAQVASATYTAEEAARIEASWNALRMVPVDRIKETPPDIMRDFLMGKKG